MTDVLGHREGCISWVLSWVAEDVDLSSALAPSSLHVFLPPSHELSGAFCAYSCTSNLPLLSWPSHCSFPSFLSPPPPPLVLSLLSKRLDSCSTVSWDWMLWPANPPAHIFLVATWRSLASPTYFHPYFFCQQTFCLTEMLFPGPLLIFLSDTTWDLEVPKGLRLPCALR